MNPQNPTAISTAILVVSFGTAVSKTRTNTIEAMEHALRHAYPQFKHYRAWTSSAIREKVLLQDGIKINSLAEAFEQMKQDGIRKVIVQPTLISDGNEYQKLTREIERLQNHPDLEPPFLSVVLGRPLLHSCCNATAITAAVMNEFQNIKNDELLIFMGHGTSDCETAIYINLNSAFHQNGYSFVSLKSMRSDSAISEIIAAAKKQNITKLILAPFMIVAGYHALRDMAGEQESSWKTQLENAGFSVQCLFKGLGQNPKIQNLLINEIKCMIK